MRDGESKVGDLAAMLRLMKPLHDLGPDPVQGRRRLVADLCRLIGRQMGALPADPASNGQPDPIDPNLSPRQHQTLKHLLRGDSEKQIAAKLKLSKHTVHVYVKGLYKHYGVSSRGELLALWVRRGGGE